MGLRTAFLRRGALPGWILLALLGNGCSSSANGTVPRADADGPGDASGGDASGGDASGGDASGGDASGGDASGGDASGGDAMGDADSMPDCHAATGQGSAGTDTWSDGSDTATVAITDRDTCSRTYLLSTTVELRDGVPNNPRTIVEQPGWLLLRSNNDMLDALYALALDEVRELSVDSITDASFNSGQPVACGGCFETGRLWHYVWTRDASYAAHLGLGLLEPGRMRNTLTFNLSTRRDGSDVQVVQDTGTGGSYPVSSDRVTWALGAWELLGVLDGAERTAFRDQIYAALVNTAEHDRRVVYDPRDGLYRGEQSFLDWREQSYPGWTADDPVQIGMSKALSTNVAHHALLEVAAALAAEQGLTTERDQYQGWADALADAINARLWIDGAGLYSTFITTELDPSPAHRFDLLGNALVATSSIVDDARARRIVGSYPHLDKGASVIWPQQQEVPIYHNRAIWPFATALWLRAGRRAHNAPAVSHAVRSLIRGAALNLSNMEAFEAVTGAAWLDDGAASGPVVNSQRQLWSVAGFVAMVHEGIFGLEMAPNGIRIAPFLPADLRTTVFGGAERIALSNLPYRGMRLNVELDLGDAGVEAALFATAITVDGVGVGVTSGTGFVDPATLDDGSTVRVTLGPVATSESITTRSPAADYRQIFGPRTPAITSISESGGRLALSIDLAGEAAGDVTLNVFRDGTQVATGLTGSTAAWTDPDSAQHSSHSYCYSVESVFVVSGLHSQHAKPVCWWGATYDRITSIDATSFVAVGGTLVDQYGRWHYQDWGDPGHSLTVNGFTPTASGTHGLQLVYGNGAGPIASGIACAVKKVEVRDGTTVVASGYVVMPQLGTWDRWHASSLLRVDLEAGVSYTIVVSEDAQAVNMSERSHFALYDGTGGQSGRFNRVNIAAVQLLWMRAP